MINQLLSTNFGNDRKIEKGALAGGEDSSTRPRALRPFLITIDGPAASGKTTVSRELAAALDFDWISTGAFYRGLALAAKYTDTDLKDEVELEKLAKSSVWSVKMGAANTFVHVNDLDVTDELTAESVGVAASQIGQIPRIRKSLLPLQRSFWKGHRGLIAEGRDCGTVVFPTAELKVYLTAKSENRAQRRAIEKNQDVGMIHKDQLARDLRDRHRSESPLQEASDSKVLDTSELSLSQVVEIIRIWAYEVHNSL